MRNLKINSMIAEHPFLRRLIQPKRIPLLFSVTIVAGIFYHYAPKLTWLWILLALLIQAPLFRLFDYVKKHPFIGGIAYIMTGAAFVAAAAVMIRLGADTLPFAPADETRRLDFMVWFLTPQSVLQTVEYEGGAASAVSMTMRLFSTDYLGYTLALFLLFTMFIATTAYYFTLVRYRVLMSFVVMIFPFAIYAKEAETMPVPSIIILLVCYFAVMIYCRQAHGEDSEVVQKYEPDVVSRLSVPNKKSAYAKVKPELLDGTFFNAAGIFMAAATILILVIPKPEVEADRVVFDSMLDFSALSDRLMDAISAFTESSDGGTYNNLNYTRTLFYTQAGEPLNLRMRTFSQYHYDSDKWTASEQYDGMPDRTATSFTERPYFRSVAEYADPAEVLTLIQRLARENPDYAETYGLSELAAMPDIDASQYYMPLKIQAAMVNNYYAFPAPLHVKKMQLKNYLNDIVPVYMNKSSILFRYSVFTQYFEEYNIEYFSERFANTDVMQSVMRRFDAETWNKLLFDGLFLTEFQSDDYELLTDAYVASTRAEKYAEQCREESGTPARVTALAESLTEGLGSDYEKAMAIRDYLRFNPDFVYSKEYQKSSTANVESFLFDTKIGVCYEYASAMAELCRAAGLSVRYVEGYQMSESDKRLLRDEQWDYAITTEHGHAFVDVYIPGFGWMMFDATSGNVIDTQKTKVNVIATLQYSGLILFAAALVLLLLLKWLVPLLREKLFRRRFRRDRNAAAVTEAFARLRRQWQAHPAQTARTLCAEKSAFLDLDLGELLSGFESAVYAERCDAETADRVYQVYCAAYDAWKPACKRHRKAEKAARKAARRKVSPTD